MAFSAALCRGLIEAQFGALVAVSGARGFPRLYVAASLKPGEARPDRYRLDTVFRGFMSRPH